jgi:hypothetical protein
MVEGDAEWFDQKKEQALSELREAEPGALQLYGQLLRDNARRAGASPEEIRVAETAQQARGGGEQASGAEVERDKRPRGSSVLRVARGRAGGAGR